jgi:nitroimidazol reductase NimA-like FMN-containing flavoprotein (pyridoxamine 5'-phosphate oxidase superfamily)
MTDLRDRVRTLLTGQYLAVLSSSREGAPYASLVAFAAAEDLRTILFATSRTTRKYANLSASASAALLIDNRRNEEADFHRAMAVTAVGRVEELEGDDRQRGEKLYLAKLPHLEDFVRAPSCALLCLAVERYILVRKFQRVEELVP